MSSIAPSEALDPALYSPSRRKLYAELRLLRARAVRLDCAGTAHALELAMEMFEVDCEETRRADNLYQLNFPSEG